MTPVTLGLILFSVAVSTLGQTCMKLGMSSAGVREAISSSGMAALYAVASNPAVLFGLTLYGCGAISWLFVLAKTDVSQAYPFIGLGFLGTLFIGYFFLAEPVSLLRVLGVLLVIAGIGVVARS